LKNRISFYWIVRKIICKDIIGKGRK